MLLAELFEDLTEVPDVSITGVQLDSRAVEPGDLFLALKGLRFDGHGFIDAAVACGAVAIAAEQPVANCPVPVVVTEDLARRVSAIASRVHGEPSKALECVCVTGTNGKTSVAHFSAELARLLGCKAGFLGTTGWGVAGEALKTAELTTADAVKLQVRLRKLVNSGVKLAALEVSSHALDQHRVDGLAPKVAVFTNLTRDHLDYHTTMQAYAAAKRRLFELPNLQQAVVNVDDEYGAQLARQCGNVSGLKTLVYSTADASQLSASSDCIESARIESLHATAAGLTWVLRSPWGNASLSAQVFGLHNAANISAAVLALASLDFDFQRLARVVPALSAPPGRLQRVTQDSADRQVFVDYAHTPGALATMLQALRPHTSGRLLCVFGCGGDRDPGKRGPMGRAVSDFADLGWLTTDNPRTEEPQRIIDDVLANSGGAENLYSEIDRRAAIGAALSAARPGDLVVVAGKGHETYQEVAGERLPFDDVAVAQQWLEVLR